MQPIVIPFEPSGLGRIWLAAKVSTADGKSLRPVYFKLDSGSDFTTLSHDSLRILGYTPDFLQSCPTHTGGVSTASEGLQLQLRYISNVTVKFGDREIQGCRVYFCLG
ncbi:MAG: hypothetical protein LBI44_00435, partial [Oscillospiraceae bacterium]|nr:hypothetical protein [Oscillospiraceae bacterium]